MDSEEFLELGRYIGLTVLVLVCVVFGWETVVWSIGWVIGRALELI